jgi:carotenoid cleavage dioxygenase-like enzyme
MSQARYNFASGFNSLSQEHKQIKLANPKNNIPNWLNGSLIKVGPAQFTIGKTKVNHWFDGLAMLYKFDYSNGNITFSNAFIKSEQYQADINGRMQCDEFATKAPLNLLERLKNIFATLAGKTTLNPSCNVNISQINKTFIAMTEVNNQIEFNPATLTTLKPISYTDNLAGQMMTAHPVLDSKKQELFNILIDIKPNKIKYQIYKTNIQTPQMTRELVAEFTRAYLFYMHSFFVTRNYVIVYNGPLQTMATRLLNKTFNEALKYNKNHQCEFIIINRHSGKLIVVPVEPMLFLHGINSYETANGQIIIDLIAYHKEENPYNNFYLKEIANNHLELTTELRRYTLKTENNNAQYEIISQDTIEFPFINPEYHNHEYRYVFATYRDESRPNDFLNGLIKIDLQNLKCKLTWHQPDLYPSEPIFVKNPESQNEDDGILMTNVFDSTRQISFLLLLDAKSFAEITRIDLPCHIPYTLHGNFYAHQDLNR